MFFRHMNTIKMLHNYVIFYHFLQNFVIKIMKIDSRAVELGILDSVSDHGIGNPLKKTRLSHGYRSGGA